MRKLPFNMGQSMWGPLRSARMATTAMRRTIARLTVTMGQIILLEASLLERGRGSMAFMADAAIMAVALVSMVAVGTDKMEVSAAVANSVARAVGMARADSAGMKATVVPEDSTAVAASRVAGAVAATDFTVVANSAEAVMEEVSTEVGSPTQAEIPTAVVVPTEGAAGSRYSIFISYLYLNGWQRMLPAVFF
jgi:hypothetical protein